MDPKVETVDSKVETVDSKVETVDWWTLLGAREEMTLSELRRQNCVDDDNVHLRARANKDAAENLSLRLLELGMSGQRVDGSGKRRRLMSRE